PRFSRSAAITSDPATSRYPAIPGGVRGVRGGDAALAQTAHASRDGSDGALTNVDGSKSAEGMPKTVLIPPRITLGPATTDPPFNISPKQDRLGLILAAFLIPLGAVAFGFAIWLYASRHSHD